MKVDFSLLNDEQIKPVLHTEGAVMVVAGAGSGKTRLLTHRIAYLVQQKHVDIYNILAITFTNKAAKEMKSRLEGMLENANLNSAWICTFHSMCVRILRRFIKNLGGVYTANFSIYGDAEKEKIVKDILKGQEIEDDFLKEVLRRIGDAKNRGMSPDEYCLLNKGINGIEEICDVYAKYEQALQKNNALDFDDLLIKAYLLLATDKETREYCQNRFEYIHIDEFQDTNEVQYKLVKLLAGARGNVMAVGDEDQSIYGWRGANVENLSAFIRELGATVYKLEQNYRSTKSILKLANTVIKNNLARIDKNLWTQNDDGDEAELFRAENESNEAEYVAGIISSAVKRQGAKYSDFAVLIRVNALTRALEEKFMQYQIPYVMYGGLKFYERKEIKDLLAYLKILVNPSDNEAIYRVINFPRRGIGEVMLEKLNAEAAVNGLRLYDVIMNIEQSALPAAAVNKVAQFSAVIRHMLTLTDALPLDSLAAELVKTLNLKAVYEADTEENLNRKMNIKAYIDSLEEYEKINGRKSLAEYLQYITLYSDLDSMDEKNNAVSIATIHSAKGLEFKNVFITGAEEGIFPLRRAMDSPQELEEERRLMYVAVTRAESKLYLSYASKRFLYGASKYSMPSRFLEEAGLEVKSRFNLGEYERRETAPSGYGTQGGAGYGGQGTGRAILQKEQAPVKKDASALAEKFTEGTLVRHRKFGEGVIREVKNELGGNIYAVVEFQAFGRMQLALAFAPLEVID